MRELLKALRRTDWTVFAVEYLAFAGFMTGVFLALASAGAAFPEMFP